MELGFLLLLCSSVVRLHDNPLVVKPIAIAGATKS